MEVKTSCWISHLPLEPITPQIDTDWTSSHKNTLKELAINHIYLLAKSNDMTTKVDTGLFLIRKEAHRNPEEANLKANQLARGCSDYTPDMRDKVFFKISKILGKTATSEIIDLCSQITDMWFVVKKRINQLEFKEDLSTEIDGILGSISDISDKSEQKAARTKLKQAYLNILEAKAKTNLNDALAIAKGSIFESSFYIKARALLKIAKSIENPDEADEILMKALDMVKNIKSAKKSDKILNKITKSMHSLEQAKHAASNIKNEDRKLSILIFLLVRAPNLENLLTEALEISKKFVKNKKERSLLKITQACLKIAKTTKDQEQSKHYFNVVSHRIWQQIESPYYRSRTLIEIVKAQTSIHPDESINYLDRALRITLKNEKNSTYRQAIFLKVMKAMIHLPEEHQDFENLLNLADNILKDKTIEIGKYRCMVKLARGIRSQKQADLYLNAVQEKLALLDLDSESHAICLREIAIAVENFKQAKSCYYQVFEHAQQTNNVKSLGWLFDSLEEKG